MLIPETEVVTVATAGVPVQCSLTHHCCAMRAMNPHGAAGLVTVGVAGMVKATGVKVVDEVPVGEAFELGRQTESDNTIDPRDYWFDAANDAQKVYVTTWRHV